MLVFNFFYIFLNLFIVEEKYKYKINENFLNNSKNKENEQEDISLKSNDIVNYYIETKQNYSNCDNINDIKIVDNKIENESKEKNLDFRGNEIEEIYELEEEEIIEINKPQETVNEKKQQKLGILNFILFLIIISYLGSSITSFFITDASLITKENYKKNSMCVFQGLFKNFFDLFAIGLTLVLSLTMRNSFKLILIDKIENKTISYIIYCLLATIILSIG